MYPVYILVFFSQNVKCVTGKNNLLKEMRNVILDYRENSGLGEIA